jgi:hypothetical protein
MKLIMMMSLAEIALAAKLGGAESAAGAAAPAMTLTTKGEARFYPASREISRASVAPWAISS